MSDLIDREAAIAAVVALKAKVMKGAVDLVSDDLLAGAEEGLDGSLLILRALPASPAGASKARALLAEWLETPNEGDPMIDVLLGVIREAHAALEGGDA